MHGSFLALLGATVTIALVHSLGPDHWMPFVMIGKANKWSRRKLILVSFVSGLGHVGSSILLGGIGIALGIVTMMTAVESSRSSIAVFLLIGFGVAYALWGLKRARHHHHGTPEEMTRKTVTLWTLFAVFVLGPCEPLIPLMFLATAHGMSGIIIVTLLFSVITVLMMIVQSLLGARGIELVKHEFAERHSHTFAGAVIALTGVFILFTGI